MAGMEDLVEAGSERPEFLPRLNREGCTNPRCDGGHSQAEGRDCMQRRTRHDKGRRNAVRTTRKQKATTRELDDYFSMAGTLELEAGGPDRGAHGPGSFNGTDSEGVRHAQQGRAAGAEQSDGSDLGEIRTRAAAHR
ncbi:hypothetical protein Zm00014a_029642 [Zea mays]|uniref:Uncharacterized protein n=1 Tax=Zea mays TaxID=4577 RepID=A0A317Y335_MAIZE|nr:hypothetical protein Zm00014a_029642 [Zea mays]